MSALFDPARRAAVLAAFGQQLVAQVVANIRTTKATRRHGPVNASGKLAASVRYELSADGQELTLYAAGYAFAVERGRGPGTAPPRAAIAAWVEAKGIVPRNGDVRGLVYAIQQKIKARGTDIWSEGQRSGVLTSAINEAALARLRQELVLSVAEEVTSFLLAAPAA